MAQAVRHDAMRARNLALVLAEVSARGALTRAALAEVTGLTKTTVSKLVADLIEAGLVVEGGAVRDGERGRPGVEVRVSGESVAAIGLEINVDYLSVRVVDLTRSVRVRRTQSVDNRAAQPVDVIARLRDLTMEVVDEVVDSGLRVVGGVLAVPGPVDMVTGTVRTAPNLGWRDVPLASLLGLPFPVRVENEANLAALGELWFGTGLSDFLHVSGEIGIGAGLVVRGRLFRGAHGFAGELGHVVVSPDGPPCRCGSRGCLEQYAGQDALLAAAHGLDTSHSLDATEDVSQGLDAALVTAGCPAGDAALSATTDPAPGAAQSSARDAAEGIPGGPAPHTHHDTISGGHRYTTPLAHIPLAHTPLAHTPLAHRDTTADTVTPAIGLATVISRLQAGDPTALAACERAGWALGVALSSAVNLVDPDAIVLGGIYAPLFPWMGNVVSSTLQARLGQMRDDVPPIVVSRLGTEAAALGAAGQVIEQVIANPAALIHA